MGEVGRNDADGDGLEDRIHPPAASDHEVRERHAANRSGWNEGAAWYASRVDETIEYLREGKSNLHPLERANLGDLGEWCDTAIHLQCASGRDTLSLWNEGAKHVVGVDISDLHIENARRTSAALDAPAAWHRSDVLDTPADLDGTADLVYTGRGAVCWIHDVEEWASVTARLLKPGGILHVLDDHPISWLFDQDNPKLASSGFSYFESACSSVGWPETYIGDLEVPKSELTRMHERLWTLADLHGALSRAGLVVERLGEHADEYWDSFPKLEPGEKRKIPLTFTMMARRP